MMERMALDKYTWLIVAVTLHATVKEGQGEVYCNINRKFQEILEQYLTFEQIAHFKHAYDESRGNCGSFQHLRDTYREDIEDETRKLPYLEYVIRVLHDSCFREVKKHFLELNRK